MGKILKQEVNRKTFLSWGKTAHGPGIIINDLQDDEEEGSPSQDGVNCQPRVSIRTSSYSTIVWRENRMFSGSPPGSQTPKLFPSSIKLQHKAGR
jgi:hypothetical protein